MAEKFPTPQERARIEQVDLNAPLEGGESDAFSQD